MSSLRKKLITICLLSLAVACRPIIIGDDNPKGIGEGIPPYIIEHEYEDELINIIKYSGRLSALSEALRLTECKNLKQGAGNYTGLSVQLRLAFTLLVSPECGELSEALNLFKESTVSVEDQDLQHLIAFQLILIDRMLEGAERQKEKQQTIAQHEQKEKQLQSELSTVRLELETLQSKLEALKSIEQTLIQRKESTVP